MAARILVIEDNRENLDLMTYLLKAYGHAVFCAEDGAEGLELARRELPDLVLTDLHMPNVDGFEVARVFRRDETLRKRPLVAVTSYAMRGDRERVLASGFDGYISKPIVPEEFVSQVEKFLDASKHSVVQPAPPSEPVPRPPVNFHSTILVVDNSAVNLSLAASTLEPFGYKVIGANSVKAALATARDTRLDLILSDLHMPDKDGFEFYQAIRNDPTLNSIPFAIISSTFWPDRDLSRALDIGVKRFIRRPLEPRQLLAEVEACLAESRGSRAEEDKHGDHPGG